ncbi:MAG TPA: mechanosensitive ion channel domain-containing protein, partial [Flavipsychrobacter sp.]|nr:mechanosensitive ion channel domain-containing protein [Flavipsychrobacter sp.]
FLHSTRAFARFRDQDKRVKLLSKLKQSADSTLDEISVDSLLGKVENVHTTLNKINSITDHGYDTRDIEDDLPDVDSNIKIISDNITLYYQVLDVKNLQMFQVLLDNIEDQLGDWRTSLSSYDKDLQNMGEQMNRFKKDSSLRSIFKDSIFIQLYSDELNDLRLKWRQATKSTAASLARINQLQADVSNQYFKVIDLQNQIKELLRRLSIKSIGKEYDYLWEIKPQTAEEKQMNESVRKSYRGQRKILRYYFRQNWDDRAIMIILGIIFFGWVFNNFRRIKRYDTSKLPTLNFRYIKAFPLLSTLVVLFSITPFFDIHPPSAYVEMMQFLLVISLTLLLWRNWPKKLFFYWLIIAVLYVVSSVTSLIITPGIGFRIWLLALDVVSVVFGFFFLIRLKRELSLLPKMVAPITVIYILLNIAAVVCNMFGRLSLAKIFSITAIYGLTQIIGLAIFIQVVTEAFSLQTVVTKLKGGLAARLHFDDIQKGLTNLLRLAAIFIWIVVFSISLNIYNELYKVADFALTKPRKIGNISFEIGNVLLFFVIIYVSNLLQKGIGSLYETTGNHLVPVVEKKGSRLMMTRLILLLIGFLLAVAASGLPIDKITILLGALGVGIGLGLQSIVNNLVSGIILIFERPFEIGDFIELDNKKGRVRNIGIRSSKLITDDGAEIILPNADLLSGRVVNWTLRDDNVRLEFQLNIQNGPEAENVQQIIAEALKQSEYVLKEVPPEIAVLNITGATINLDVLVWVNDIRKTLAIKSELLMRIHKALAEHNIKIT